MVNFNSIDWDEFFKEAKSAYSGSKNDLVLDIKNGRLGLKLFPEGGPSFEKVRRLFPEGIPSLEDMERFHDLFNHKIKK
jgi:hypothetical protein